MSVYTLSPPPPPPAAQGMSAYNSPAATAALRHTIMRGKALVRHRLVRDEENPARNVMFIDWIEAPPGEGSALLAYVEELAVRWRAPTVRLATCVEPQEDNDAVLRRFNFFQKHGYRFTGLERVDLPGGGTVVRFLREKTLEMPVEEKEGAPPSGKEARESMNHSVS